MERPVRSMYMDILERRAVGANLYRVTIAANEKVRQPPELEFDGLSTENYSRNPVVMWAHDSVGRSPSGGLPIGRTLGMSKGAGVGIVAEFEFLADDPFAQRVKNAWDKGFLQAASISWVPLKTVPAQDGGWRDTQSDLLEWSIVSVPADPDALRASHRRMIGALLGEKPLRSAGWGPEVEEEHDAASSLRRQAMSGEDPGLPHAPGLSADDYGDLSTALALLRGVVEGRREPAGGEMGPAVGSDAQDGLGGDGMAEVREMVGAIKSSLNLS